MGRLLLPGVLFFAAASASMAALAADAGTDERSLVIENHRWHPDKITIPADRKVLFVIENRDDTPEEFDSRDLNREKVVMGKTKGQVYIGPLKPGRYKFQGEYHATTAQGVVIVK